SWWAYYELGWGGWWFWDPVENASLIPWLAGTALLHSAIVVEKRDSLKSWTILLAIITFSLSLLGTFLVRSGVLTSVHAFASDPTRGVFILGLLAVTTGGSLLLFALRAPALRQGGLFAPISREGGLLLNNVLLSAAAGTVLLGTLYPLFADTFDLGKVSVGAPFFNATFLPLMVPLVVAMAAGPLLSWKRSDVRGVALRLWAAMSVTIAMFVVVWLLAGGSWAALGAAGGMALATWLLVATLTEYAERIGLSRVPLGESLRRAAALPRAAHGMTLAHAGFALVIAGITGASFWSVEKIQTLHPGEMVSAAGYDFTFRGTVESEGPNYAATRGTMEITRNGKPVVTLFPERRQYVQPPQPSTEAAIHGNGLSDLYTAIGDDDGKGGTVTRIYYKPLVPWLWIGSLMMALGGLVSLTDRRHRIGAPVKRSPVPSPKEA
ncbi:MAG: heme lyase CcmF/NrfE family subunit, partial [Alphaproteobacteria bacterium]|nr:heme lyase CcmF/NrfE family subunit [Alphaproteobacteria bacterium]